ncbi:MAG: dehydrogenase, partial [Limisphaerales bacterium]
EYHGRLIMGNIHGQRLNMDVPERAGSGYVGRHAPDFLNFNDRASQTLNQQIDQDGNVFVIDWYDRQQCHNQRDPNVHDRSNGRIYKISYGDKKGTQVDLAKLEDKRLVDLLLNASPNAWYARHASRLLQERAADKQLRSTTPELMRVLLNVNPDKYLLRVMWSLHATAGLTEKDAMRLFSNKSENARAWTIQLLCEDHKPGEAALKEFARLAKEDPSPLVRLYLASACQRLTVAERAPIVEALLAHAEDAADQNLPLMYWYATEPIVAAEPAKGALLLARAKIPIIREYITRRLTAK